MRKFTDLFPSKYLRGADIEHPVQARVKHVSVEPVGREQEDKAVCYFVGDLRPAILNKTNCVALTNITGTEDMDEWGGARVELYRENILLHGERVAALRIRAVRGEAQADDIPDSWEDEPPMSGGKKKKSA
jgi:hypothetical protein